MSMMEKYRKIPLLTKLLVAMVIGIILGAVFGEKINVIKPLGTVFLNLLKMENHLNSKHHHVLNICPFHHNY